MTNIQEAYQILAFLPYAFIGLVALIIMGGH